jgi:hypothetical protein
MLDISRGIYLFEYKDWSYDDLKNSKIEKASQQESSQETLAFEKSHEFIKQKFTEITQSECVPIFNFLLMANLNSYEYPPLDESFKELLPNDKIMFNNLSQDEILQKIKAIPKSLEPLPDVANIMGNILVQYAILGNDNSLHMATLEQQHFIEAPFSFFEILSAPTGSGKTSAILLKIILQQLRHPEQRIMVIKSTTLSCDLLKRKLLNIVDHACIELDIPAIEVITPLELINRNLKSFNKKPIENELHIDDILMSKEFNIADIIICDDSDMLTNEFKNYLKHIQKRAGLLLVRSAKLLDNSYTFNRNFVQEKKRTIFVKANPHAKVLQIISLLLCVHMPEDILVVSSTLSKEKLNDDLEFFIKDKAVLLDSSKKLIDQDINNLLLSTYSDINSIDAKFVILMDICFATMAELEHAYNICGDSVYILYQDECEKLASLRNNFEDHQE